jgi:hypothetical protein
MPEGACKPGMVFEAAQLIDLDSSPVLASFFSDASFSGPNMSHHPIHRKSNEYLKYSNCVLVSVMERNNGPLASAKIFAYFTYLI